MVAKISKKQISTLLMISAAILVVVIIVFSVKIGMYYRDAKRTETIYRTLADIPDATGGTVSGNAVEADEVSISFHAQIAAAQAQNPDVVGWVKIDDTSIHYPVLKGTDNIFYLKHNLLKESSSHASIMIDVNHTQGSNPVILYGHNMRDGTMFHDLMSYKDKDFFMAHSIIHFETTDGYAAYRIFAVIIIDSDTDIPQAVMTMDERETFVASAISHSLYQTNISVNPEDRILILTTCTYETKDATLAVIARQE